MVYVLSLLALFLFGDKLVAQHEICHDPNLRLYQLEYDEHDNLIKDTWIFEDEFTQIFVYKYVKRKT
ncbi:MAG: hypothetical protein J7M01_04425 [Candidatus Marinimicrobia bacterium]|nr:hypothetical protein [Candidatus Neomarinimicrobiota bacterium]